MNGHVENTRVVNKALDEIEGALRAHYNQMLRDSEPITAGGLKNKFFGINDKRRSLIKAFEYHNSEMEKRLGSGYSKGSLKNYRSTIKFIKEYVPWKYNRQDILLAELDYKFISDYELFCKNHKGTGQNGTMKHIQRIKKVINMAIAHDWIAKDPFKSYKCTFKSTTPVFLDEFELDRIEKLVLPAESLKIVRDVFIFSCYTGLAHADVLSLTKINVVRGSDGDMWIHQRRKKTDTISKIPLLHPAMKIIDRYLKHPKVMNEFKLLPVISNQKSNKHLKEIARLAGINKRLTFHAARHTFATTVTLTNDVPIETVSKMLGHTNLRTTQIYAKVVDKKISQDMQALREKLKRS